MGHLSMTSLSRSAIAVALSLILSAPAAQCDDAAPPAEQAPAQTAAAKSAEASVASPRVANPERGPRPFDADELADLSARAEQPAPEVVGGALSNEHLTYIVIALAAAVIVLIAK